MVQKELSINFLKSGIIAHLFILLAPMQVLRFIPNALTLGNLFMGVLAIILLKQEPMVAVTCVVFGAVFDFFDGFSARKIGVSNEMGKQLDSLADMVTFGVAPALMAFELTPVNEEGLSSFLPYVCLSLVLASAYRLAKFNLSTSQTENFEGLPTPANALFWIGLFIVPIISDVSKMEMFIADYPFLLPIASLLFSFFMISNIPMFGLKFKNFNFRDNIWKYLLLISAVLMFVFFKWLALPFIVVLYIILSIVKSRIA